MPAPLINLIVFLLGGALAGIVFWPGRGLLSRSRRGRMLASRVQLEDALKHIYHHEAREQTCTLSSLGGALETTAARTIAVVTKLQHAGLARVVDGRLVLTEEGTRYALEVVRAHRLWERYLADETGVDPQEWHARAERQEHALTRAEADALSERLGHPRFDPHGDPIPTADGSVPVDPVVPLSALEPGERAVVTHLEDEPEIVYAQLVALGFYLGMVLRLDARADQRLVCEADGRKIVLAPLLAENVSIQRLPAGEADVMVSVESSLADLDAGESAEIVRISAACRGLERRRLMDLGLVPGTRVAFDQRGLSGGLSAYRVRGSIIALRDEQARLIGVARSQRVKAGEQA